MSRGLDVVDVAIVGALCVVGYMVWRNSSAQPGIIRQTGQLPASYLANANQPKWVGEVNAVSGLINALVGMSGSFGGSDSGSGGFDQTAYSGSDGGGYYLA